MSDIASADEQEDARPRTWLGSLSRARGLVTAVMRAETDRTLAQRTALTAFVIRAVSAAMALVLQILMARWLGGYQYGVFAFVFVTLVIVGGLVPLGFPTAGQRFIAQYKESGRTDLLRGFLYGSRAVVVAVATLIAALGVFGLWLSHGFVDSEYLLPLYLVIVCLPAYALMDVQDSIARNYSWIDLALALPYLARPIIILAVVGTTMLVTGRADAVTASYGLIVAIWTTCLVQSVLLELRLSRRVERGLLSYDWKPWLVVSLPIFLVESFYLLLTSTDIVVLSILESPETVGIYYAVVKTLSLVSFVPFAVTAALSHKFAEYGVSGDRQRLQDLVRDSVNWTFWPALALTLAMLAVARPLLGLFGSEFVAGYSLLFPLTLGLMARASVGPIDRVLNMLGQQNLCAVIYALAFALNLLLNFALIPMFGPAGAAWATSAALVTESLLLFLAARSRLGLHVFIVGARRPATPPAGARPSAEE